MLLGPRAMVPDPGRRLHVWSFPLAGYDGGPTYAERQRFELLYYGEAAINPFFEGCGMVGCSICDHPAAWSHRAYLSAFDPVDSLRLGEW